MNPEVYQEIYEIENSHWWYLGRRKLVKSLIKGFLPDSPDLHILDVGCGSGAIVDYMRDLGRVRGVDFSEQALEFCKRRNCNNVCLGDANALPFAEGSFDLIVALDLLEHLQDDRDGLGEFYRVLKEGGMAVVFVPALRFLWGNHDVTAHHYRRYSLPELRRKMEDAGFVVSKISYANAILFPLIFAVRKISKFLNVRAKSENRIHPARINGLLTRIFSLESIFLKRMSFPVGVSIVCLGKKAYAKR